MRLRDRLAGVALALAVGALVGGLLFVPGVLPAVVLVMIARRRAAVRDDDDEADDDLA